MFGRATITLAIGPHSSLVMNFRRSVIIAELWWPKSQDVANFCNFCVFWKNNSLWEKFQNSVPKVFIATLIDVLCSNFVKFG